MDKKIETTTSVPSVPSVPNIISSTFIPTKMSFGACIALKPNHTINKTATDVRIWYSKSSITIILEKGVVPKDLESLKTQFNVINLISTELMEIKGFTASKDRFHKDYVIDKSILSKKGKAKMRRANRLVEKFDVQLATVADKPEMDTLSDIWEKNKNVAFDRYFKLSNYKRANTRIQDEDYIFYNFRDKDNGTLIASIAFFRGVGTSYHIYNITDTTKAKTNDQFELFLWYAFDRELQHNDYVALDSDAGVKSLLAFKKKFMNCTHQSYLYKYSKKNNTKKEDISIDEWV